MYIIHSLQHASEAKNSGEENTIDISLQNESKVVESSNTSSTEQLMDQEVKPIILYLKDGTS